MWFTQRSGSRGLCNFIGTTVIALARQDALRNHANLPDCDLAYFVGPAKLVSAQSD